MDFKKIKTFEDACKKLGIDTNSISVTLPDQMKHHQDALDAHAKLVVCAEAINDGWKPDWSNSSQPKYTPWFDMRSSASGGFAYDGCGRWITASGVGSRLSFESREKAKYFGTQFRDLYESYFVIKE